MPDKLQQTPLYRSSRAAWRNGLRSALAMIVTAIPFVLSGWPATSQGYSLVGVTLALSAINPRPAVFATGALVAMPLAAACAGITEFLILDGADQFPLLCIAMAPTVFLGAMIVMSGNPKSVGIGALLLVFFPVLLEPSNPQSFDPQTYIYTATLATTAVIALYIILATMLPTSDARRRRWIMDDIQRELEAALYGKTRYYAGAAAFHDADRIGQLIGLDGADTAYHVAGLRDALRYFDLTVTIGKVNESLRGLRHEVSAGLGGSVRRALAARDPLSLRKLAEDLATSRSDDRPGDRDLLTIANDLEYIVNLLDIGDTNHLMADNPG